MKRYGVVFAILTSVLCAVSHGDEIAVGNRSDNFTLIDSLGANHSLTDWKDKKAIVVVFLGTECPLAKHYGKAFRFTARYPNGTSEILLDVPRYDFNWQNVYVLDAPKRMPKGTLMMCDGVFDNSNRNLANPDPTAEVSWGDQTSDEMMLGSFVISLTDAAVVGEFPKVTHVRDDSFDVEFRYRPERDTQGLRRGLPCRIVQRLEAGGREDDRPR